MIDPKIIQLYYNKYLPKKLDLFGILFYPTLDDDLGISWRMENPKDISYNVEVLKGYLESKVTDFFKLIGRSEELLKSPREKLARFEHKPNFYINSQDKQEIKRLSESIKKINYENYEIPVRIKKISFEPGYDWIRMDVSFQFEDIWIKRKGPHNRDWLEKMDKDDASSYIRNSLYIDDDFQQDYMYTLMDPILSFINSEPTIVDTDYIFIQITFGFYYPDGEHV